MIAAWMLYCVAIAVLFVVVGEALERALHLVRRATRWAWVAALAGSYLVPAAALLRPSAFGALPLPLAHPLATGPITVQQPRGALPPPTRSFSIGDLDTALTWAWGLSAGAVALALLGAGLRLAAWRRRWRVTTLDGRPGGDRPVAPAGRASRVVARAPPGRATPDAVARGRTRSST